MITHRVGSCPPLGLSPIVGAVGERDRVVVAWLHLGAVGRAMILCAAGLFEDGAVKQLFQLGETALPVVGAR